MLKLPFWKDAVERVLASVLGALGAYLAAVAITPMDLQWWQGLALAGLAGLVSAVKAAIARYIGDPDSASLATPVEPNEHLRTPVLRVNRHSNPADYDDESGQL